MLFRYKLNNYTMSLDLLASNVLSKTSLLPRTTLWRTTTTSLLNPVVTSGKIYRLANQLVPHVDKSNMAQKHAAMLISGGKPVAIGYNHDRMTSKKKFIMSYHAEIHSIAQYFDLKNVSHLKRYLNDTEKCKTFKNSCCEGCGSNKGSKKKNSNKGNKRHPSDLTPPAQ